MQGLYFGLLLSTAALFGCDNCKDDDCGGDDTILIKIVSDDEANYSDSISFYYLNDNQQRVEATIEPNRPGSSIYYAFLDYRKPAALNRCYLEVRDQIRTVDIQTRYDEDSCCEDYLRFEQITVDGVTTSLPIKIVID